MTRLRVLACCLALVGLAVSASAAEYVVVANPSVPVDLIEKGHLAGIFLSSVKEWEDSTPIVPVDQSARAKVRESFSNEVLGFPVAAALQFWSKAIGPGRLPPDVLGSDSKVLEFVAANGGAVGYVSADAKLRPGVKVLTVTD